MARALFWKRFAGRYRTCDRFLGLPRFQSGKMAPETGLEPVTRRLIPTRRDSAIEQVFSNPTGRFHTLDLPLSFHRDGACAVFFTPNQLPGTVLTCEFSEHSVIPVVGVQA